MSAPELNLLQSAQLDGLAQPVRVIAVTGGKGGVGKTSVAVNLATALAKLRRRVVLLDGDLGLANADVFLGLSPRYTLSHVLSGERTLDEILVDAPQGFQLIPAAAGAADMAQLGVAEHLGLVRAFSALAARLDVLIVDTAAGLSHSVLQFSQAAQHVVVVICDEPASITDAYALVKVLSRNHGVRNFRVLTNQIRPPGTGTELFQLQFAGEIPADEYLHRAVRGQRAVMDQFPGSPAARAFKKLAAHADTWPVPEGPRGNIEFFMERLVRRTVTRPLAVT
jgi:flagellar biosynthesis protein FlhG